MGHPADLQSEMMLRAMILASIADRRRLAEEDRVALAVYAVAAGVRLAKADYDRTCAGVEADPEAAWRWIGERHAALSVAQREEVVRAVVRVAMADAELQDEEVGVFRRMAQVLALSTGDVRRLMNQVWREERASAPPALPRVRDR
jgi:uncharacterized tellurite resistance protein B-like protein